MSFVQFNLLPDIKLEFNRAQKAKRLVYSASILGVAAVLTVFIVSFLVVNVLQKKLLSDANNDMTHYSQQLKGIKDLDKILTIQNQLDALPSLHQSKHLTSRLFGYLPQVTPVNANIGKLNIDTSVNTISISGTADTVETINKFVDTLKFTTYSSQNDQSTKKAAFSNVVLSKVDRTAKDATYTIDANYDPPLFDATQKINLTVPTEVTTRSVLNAPGAAQPLFNGKTDKTESQQDQNTNGTGTNNTNTTQQGGQ
jgi:hypothetical protein